MESPSRRLSRGAGRPAGAARPDGEAGAPTSSLRWSLLVAGEALIALFFLVLWSDAETPLFRQAQLGIVSLLGAIGWLVVLARPRALPALLVVAPLPLLASLVLTTATSAYPTLSWHVVWECASMTGILWLLCLQAGHPTGRRNLVAAMGIVAALVIAAYLVTVLLAWREWLAAGFPVTSVPLRPWYTGGILHIPAWLADVVVLCAPAVVVTLWRSGARIVAAALATGGMLAVVLTGTRSVLLLIVAVAVAVILALVLRSGRRRTRLVLVLALIGIAGVAGAVVLAAGRGFDLGRSSSYASAVDRFLSSPLVGSGPGTYGVTRMSDPVDGLWNLAQPDALNVVLTSASDSGLAGLLGLAVAAILGGLAIRRSWRATGGGQLLLLAALAGLAVVSGHAMGEVVFALTGIVLLWIATFAIAATVAAPSARASDRRSRPMWAALGAGALVFVFSLGSVIRTDGGLESMAIAEAGPATADVALLAARDATSASPDSVPAWWVRMVAADRAGDMADALAAAHEIVALEGFGQEWLSLATLLARSGDAAAAQVAMDRAVALVPADPVVELNAAIFYDASGATAAAEAAARQLLVARSDIEPILRSSLPRIAALVGRVRADVATQRVATGDPDGALLIALAGEDPGLAGTLLARLGAASAGDPPWAAIVAAWFGDGEARAGIDAATRAHPTPAGLTWSWRLAVRACDLASADGWERAIGISAATQLAIPVLIGAAPAFQVRSLPNCYPTSVWGTNHPERPYVAGIWTYAVGTPACTAGSTP